MAQGQQVVEHRLLCQLAGACPSRRRSKCEEMAIVGIGAGIADYLLRSGILAADDLIGDRGRAKYRSSSTPP
jgi:hypothetical protein